MNSNPIFFGIFHGLGKQLSILEELLIEAHIPRVKDGLFPSVDQNHNWAWTVIGVHEMDCHSFMPILASRDPVRLVQLKWDHPLLQVGVFGDYKPARHFAGVDGSSVPGMMESSEMVWNEYKITRVEVGEEVNEVANIWGVEFEIVHSNVCSGDEHRRGCFVTLSFYKYRISYL